MKHTAAGITIKLKKMVRAFWKHLFMDEQTGTFEISYYVFVPITHSFVLEGHYLKPSWLEKDLGNVGASEDDRNSSEEDDIKDPIFSMPEMTAEEREKFPQESSE